MQAPPFHGSPTELVPAGAPNPGSSAVRVGWDGMRYFWGTVAQQAWQDLDAVSQIGVILV